MEGIHDYFTGWDWAVLFGYLLLTTWVGHAMRGKQANIKDFFAGGRSLPWPAVSGSIIATSCTTLSTPSASRARPTIGSITSCTLIHFVFRGTNAQRVNYATYRSVEKTADQGSVKSGG